MDVKTFLSQYREDLNVPLTTSNWDFDKYRKWQDEFSRKTVQYHKSVKQSYFQLSNEYIRDKTFDRLAELFPFHGCGLFHTEDEVELLELVSNTSSTLTQITDKQTMESALDYLYRILDLMFHEVLYETTKENFINTLKTLSKNIERTKELDPRGCGELVEQKIELITAQNAP